MNMSICSSSMHLVFAMVFARAFPGSDPHVSGAFGGWMLICSAGAVVGAWVRP